MQTNANKCAQTQTNHKRRYQALRRGTRNAINAHKREQTQTNANECNVKELHPHPRFAAQSSVPKYLKKNAPEFQKFHAQYDWTTRWNPRGAYQANLGPLYFFPCWGLKLQGGLAEVLLRLQKWSWHQCCHWFISECSSEENIFYRVCSCEAQIRQKDQNQFTIL